MCLIITITFHRSDHRFVVKCGEEYFACNELGVPQGGLLGPAVLESPRASCDIGNVLAVDMPKFYREVGEALLGVQLAANRAGGVQSKTRNTNSSEDVKILSEYCVVTHRE